MKKTTFVLFASLIVLVSACSKDKDDNSVPPPSAEGYWVGTYSATGQLGNSNYAMLVKPGGVVRVYDLDNKTDTSAIPAGSKMDGVWTLNGTQLQTTYYAPWVMYTTVATVNAAYSNMTGTWSANGVAKGNITLNK